MSKKIMVLHPILFAIFPILSLYANNSDQFSHNVIIIPITISVCATLLIWILFFAVLKSKIKAGLILSLLLLLFFSYGHLYSLIKNVHISLAYITFGANDILFLTYYNLLVLSIYFTIKTKNNLYALTKILNIISIILVVIPLLKINIYKINKSDNIIPAINETYPNFLMKDAPFPDIYYIILDGYARADVLKEIYHYDNGDFIKYLTKKGFHVITNSRSNYCHTSLSLASSLNFEYINNLDHQINIESADRNPLINLIRNNRVYQFVKHYGYKTIAFSSGYYATEMNNADIYIQFKPYNNLFYNFTGWFWDEFQNGLINTTPIAALMQKFADYNPFDLHRKRILYTFNQLPHIAKFNKPVFVFAHIMVPHPPFVFDRNGQAIYPKGNYSTFDGSHLIRKDKMERNEYIYKYLNQLKFVNQKIKATIEELLSQSIESPIIIVQSDHGPASMLDWEVPNNSNFKERLSILNAYYLPNIDFSNFLNDHITPVNTFRIIFNQYFGTNYKLLDDHSYFSTWNHPYKFIKINQF